MPTLPAPRTLNIGVLAHIDAGKTTLTERLLYQTGAITRLGSVDAGTTQTDSDDIERRRGITIRSAVACFTVGARQVNLIDTPGHSDFIAEVERALDVLDGAILVLSAVEGVQAQTRVLMKTLRAMRLPTILFANKLDRSGARGGDLVGDIRRLLRVQVVPMNAAHRVGTAAVRTGPNPDLRAEAAEVLAGNDDALLAEFVDGAGPDDARVAACLAAQTARGQVHPLYFGSARGGQGVADLLDGIQRFLPPAPAGDGALTGTVFAVERGRAGEKVAYVRLRSGEVRARQRVAYHRREPDGTLSEHRELVTGLRVVGPGNGERLTGGNIATVRGLSGIRVGDRLGEWRDPAAGRRFAPPSLETVARPAVPEQANRLHAALASLAEQDPLIHSRSVPGGTSVLLYGEVQKEIIAETLARDFGVEATFERSRTVHLERPAGTGSARDAMAGSGFPAGVGLRIEPAPAGTGVTYGIESEYGALPLAYHRAIEQSARRTLAQGLYGWPVTDCAVVLTHTEYAPPESVAGDFRVLTPMVLMRALHAAGTRVYEPCHSFEVEVPEEAFTPVTACLLALGARIRTSMAQPPTWLITGDITARVVHDVARQLPTLTSGEGVWWSRPEGDRLVAGARPTRPRTDGNPLNRQEFLRSQIQRDRPP